MMKPARLLAQSYLVAGYWTLLARLGTFLGVAGNLCCPRRSPMCHLIVIPGQVRAHRPLQRPAAMCAAHSMGAQDLYKIRTKSACGAGCVEPKNTCAVDMNEGRGVCRCVTAAVPVLATPSSTTTMHTGRLQVLADGHARIGKWSPQGPTLSELIRDAATSCGTLLCSVCCALWLCICTLRSPHSALSHTAPPPTAVGSVALRAHTMLHR